MSLTDTRPLRNTPFFIVGVHRSGTTLLRYMLSSHSRMFVPPESDFIPRFFLGNPHRQLRDMDVVRMLNIIFRRYRFVGDWRSDPSEPGEFLGQMAARTPAAFLDALYSAYARQYGAERWGDKTPIYASYLDLIHEIFPQAQFIHIIRDPRDAALSMLDKYERDEFHVDIFFAARNWVRRIRKAQASGRRLGGDLYYELRYEALVDNPEHELRAICEFLGESFEPTMLQHHRLASQQEAADSHFFGTVRQPLTPKRVGRWHERMSIRDQRLVERVCGVLMDELGYEREDLGRMPPREQVQLVALGGKYATLQVGRRVLQAFGLVSPI